MTGDMKPKWIERQRSRISFKFGETTDSLCRLRDALQAARLEESASHAAQILEATVDLSTELDEYFDDLERWYEQEDKGI